MHRALKPIEHNLCIWINFQVIFLHSDLSRFVVSEVIVTGSDYSFFAFLCSNKFEMNFCKV